MQLNEHQLGLISDLCDYAENATLEGDELPPQVKELRSLIRQNTWYGPFDNPFKAYINCANGNNLDTTEVLQFVLPGWLCDWDLDGRGSELLDNLLQELAGYTGIVVQMRHEAGPLSPMRWFARLDKEVE